MTVAAIVLQRRRWLELVLLFVVAPALISLGPRWLVLVAIVSSGAICWLALLADPSFQAQRLWGWRAWPGGWRTIVVRALVVGVGLLALGVIARGWTGVFLLPRTRPALWLAVLCLYPLISVVPQEIMFRAFFFHRYERLFRRPASLLAVNAVLFGWSHIIVHNWMAMALATVGGLLFALTFQRTRSTALVVFEHALYGELIFSVGIGGMFVNGVRLLSQIIK